MKNYPQIGIQIPQILLPKAGAELNKWAVIACDQFTSQPEYWQEAEKIVGDAPSTLKMILPEVYLGKPEEQTRIHSTQQQMKTYLGEGLFDAYEGLLLVERSVNGKTRYGLMMALDLEKYDYNKGSQTLVRATEGTILDRLPPRMRIREGAALELPHILVLIDDPQRSVIEPLVAKREELKKIYDFELMLGSGHLKGYYSTEAKLEAQVVSALEKLSTSTEFQTKYGVGSDKGTLLFAVGDGNHSLATAKAIWEKIKTQVGPDHPARYALIELENVHDQGLDFEPIHRILFDVKEDFQKAMTDFYGSNFHYKAVKNAAEMVELVKHQTGKQHVIGVTTNEGCGIISIDNPSSNLPVGTLQSFLDTWLKKGGAGNIDYVHGAEATERVGSQKGNIGFFLPAMDKSDLFKTVILDGALPRKTFSMGEAEEKRFYMECRKIA